MINTVIQRNIHISHRKAKLVCDLIRNKEVREAITILENTNKKMSPIIKKLLESAIANAINNHAMDASKLYIYEIVANQGPTWKRTMPRAKGSADLMLKRTTHLEIKLSDEPNERAIQIEKLKNRYKKSAKKITGATDVKVVDKTNKASTGKKTNDKVESKKPTTAKPAAAKKATAAKPAAAKKATTTTVKPVAVKKATAAKPVTAKKPAAKKATTTTAKPAAKKATAAKPATAKKPVAKKATTSTAKPAVKKATAAKPATAKKAPAKKPATAKKPAAKKGGTN